MGAATRYSVTCKRHSHHRAGCPACRARSAERYRVRHRLIAYGQWQGMVDTAEATAHARRLVNEHAMSAKQIAALAGVAADSVDKLLAGKRTRALARTVEAILAVQPAAPKGERKVAAHGAARRLQALMAEGWDATALAPLIGVSPISVQRWRREAFAVITYRRHERIREVYERLADHPRDDSRARRTAQALGYLPPLAWDDDTIDDPQAQPWAGQAEDAAPVVDEVAIRRALAGERIPLTRLEKHHALHARGRMSIQRAADVLHLSYSRAKELANLPLPATAEEVAA